MIKEEERLERLLALAREGRRLSADREHENLPGLPPPGFSTRLAARWAAARRGLSAAEAWERMSWWGTGLAGAACLLVIAVHQQAPEPTGFELLLSGTLTRPLF